MLDLKAFIRVTPNEQAGRSPEPARTARAKAANGTTPTSLKIRLSALQAEKLERMSAARGVSLATIVRELIERAS
jgi:hypothetical protein